MLFDSFKLITLFNIFEKVLFIYINDNLHFLFLNYLEEDINISFNISLNIVYNLLSLYLFYID